MAIPGFMLPPVSLQNLRAGGWRGWACIEHGDGPNFHLCLQTEIVPESEEEETDSQASDDELEEIEEMNEELSDYDDEEVLRALTKDR